MAAMDIAHRSISLRTERRPHPAGAAMTAASPVDAAFVDLEPGASVASQPPLGADDAGAAQSDRSRLATAARGVRPLLHNALRRRPDRRRPPLSVRYA